MNTHKDMMLINRIGFTSHESAVRWKRAELKNPREEYKDCLMIIKMCDIPGSPWMIEFWKEVK